MGQGSLSYWKIEVETTALALVLYIRAREKNPQGLAGPLAVVLDAMTTLPCSSGTAPLLSTSVPGCTHALVGERGLQQWYPLRAFIFKWLWIEGLHIVAMLCTSSLVYFSFLRLGSSDQDRHWSKNSENRCFQMWTITVIKEDALLCRLLRSSTLIVVTGWTEDLFLRTRASSAELALLEINCTGLVFHWIDYLGFHRGRQAKDAKCYEEIHRHDGETQKKWWRNV